MNLGCGGEGHSVHPARDLCQDRGRARFVGVIPALSTMPEAGAIPASLPETQPEARTGSEFLWDAGLDSSGAPSPHTATLQESWLLA